MTASRLKLKLLVAIATCAFLGLSPTIGAETADDATHFISLFGKPDVDKSSESENPRPPIVTRQLIYKKENVRVVYLANVPAGSPPPYDSWKLIGFQDQRTGAVLKPAEAVRRLEHRRRK